MTPRLLLQLAHLATREADAALPDPYAWPPAPEATPAQLDEAAHLRAIAAEAFARWAELAGEGEPGGTDAAFGVTAERG